MIKIREEVARAFQPATIMDLESKNFPSDHPAQLACVLLLTDFFKVPLRAVRWRLASADLRDKARALYLDDVEFQRRYGQAQNALAHIDRDVIPEAVLKTFTPLSHKENNHTYGTAAEAMVEHRLSFRRRSSRIGSPD